MVEPRKYDCTSAAARWCPIHGNCACWDPDDGEAFRGHGGTDEDGKECPLHGKHSNHGADDD